MDIERQYIVDESNRRVAVQVDIDTFEKIEETLENFGLYRLMREADEDEDISIEAARLEYGRLEKV